MTKIALIEGLIQQTVVAGFFVATDDGRCFKIHINEVERYGIDERDCDRHVTAEIATDIHPPPNLDGWVKHGTMRFLEGDRSDH